MGTIKKLIDAMHCELDTAKKYYRKSLELKETYPQVASVFNEIARQELEHCNKFSATASSVLSRMKTNGEDTAKAEVIWDYEHASIVAEYDELKYKLTKFSI